MQPLIFIPIEFGSPEFDLAVGLRYDILRKPLGREFTAEQIAAEWNEHHLACFSQNYEMLGYLNLQVLDEKTVKMRQVAVAEKFQKQGIGAALVGFSEKFARENGFSKITLHARETAVPFYLKLQYRKIGERFLEVGIPHFEMEKII